RESPGVDGEQGFGGAAGSGVQSFGNDAFARSVLSSDEDMRAGGAHPGDDVEDGEHGGRLGDEVGAAMVPKGAVLGVEALAFEQEAQGVDDVALIVSN